MAPISLTAAPCFAENRNIGACEQCFRGLMPESCRSGRQSQKTLAGAVMTRTVWVAATALAHCVPMALVDTHTDPSSTPRSSATTSRSRATKNRQDRCDTREGFSEAPRFLVASQGSASLDEYPEKYPESCPRFEKPAGPNCMNDSDAKRDRALREALD